MGQRVLITAAAAGIGRSIAEAFVAAGAAVEVCDVDDRALATMAEANPTVGVTEVDLADGDAIDEWLAGAIARLGGVDVLVNNAGVKGPTAFVEDVTPDEWAMTMSVCLDSHYRCVRHVAPILKAQGSGTVINLSSMAGMVGYGMRTPYAAAKWAVVGLTKSLAIELGPHDVTCNCICPGSVAGERIERVISAEAAQRGFTADLVHGEYLSGQSISVSVEPT